MQGIVRPSSVHRFISLLWMTDYGGPLAAVFLAFHIIQAALPHLKGGKRTQGWLYLAVISARDSVIGWADGPPIDRELVEQALIMALANRQPLAGLVHHSDRGSQYAATRYQQVIMQGHPSMSRRGNCWDNACVESFVGSRSSVSGVPSALCHTQRSHPRHL